MCILISSNYTINQELTNSKHAGQFSDIGLFFDQFDEKNIYILWDYGANSPLEQIHFYLTGFWCKYSLIKFTIQDEINGELKNRLNSANYLISTQSIDLPLIISSKSDYKLYSISSNTVQNQSILLVNRLKGNWNPLERDEDGKYFRWIFNDATICVYSDAERNATLSFEAQSLNFERYLSVSNQKSKTQTFIIPTTFLKVQYNLSLKKGENDIFLHVSSINASINDPKSITVAIRNLSVE